MALLSRSLAIENEGQQDHDLDADFALVSRSMAIEDDDLDAETCSLTSTMVLTNAERTTCHARTDDIT